MQLHGIKTPGLWPAGSRPKGVDEITDLILGEFRGNLRKLVNIYGRRCQRLPARVLGRCLAAGVDQLDGNATAGRVDVIGQLFKVALKIIGMNAHLARQPFSFRPYKRIAQNNQAHSAPSQHFIIVD